MIRLVIELIPNPMQLAPRLVIKLVPTAIKLVPNLIFKLVFKFILELMIN